MRPLIIVNPASSSGTTADGWPKIASELARHLGAFEPKFTQQAGDATRIAADAAEKGRLIIACGGDGTICEVANGILLAGGDAELGILPSGTGGDFRKTLGISSRTSDAAKILRDGQTRLIDVGRVTYTNEAGAHESRYFVGVASFGMSADVISKVKAGGPDWLPAKGPKWLTGRVKFGLSMAETALKTGATRVVVQLDDHPEQRMTVANLCIANARYFGGGMMIAPDAKIVDGKLDVVSIGDLGATQILANAPRLYSGAHLNMDKVGHTLARKITARPMDKNVTIEIEVDGELPGYLPATFQIVPKALRVRCPVV
jgi:diacylglycerol kinase (ATP)